ncbi:MAG TPA: ABC transporter permease [Vicinamibacterales bacterium]|nr:ABC transporter permease [Vicinamibacterales bacterium]
MRQIWLGANAVFRESVRDRVPYSIVVFAVLMIGASYLISQLTAGQDMKIIKDLGLAALSIFGLLIAVFIGVGLVTKEVEKRSVYGLLTKPLSRSQFLLGKYAGLVMTLAVNLAVMTVALYVVLFYSNWMSPAGLRLSWEAPAADPRMLMAIVLIFAELMLVTALALFFSTFTSPLWATLLTLGLWVAGHFNADLRNFGAVVDSAPVIWLGRVIYYVIPNLAPFDIKAEVVHGIHVPARHVAYTLAYAALYISVLLTASVTSFGRRDFK